MLISLVITYIFLKIFFQVLFPYFEKFLGQKILSYKLKEVGSWVVITGATDGIGKAMAYECAIRGMDLLLIGRNQTKLDDTKKLIQNDRPNCNIKLMVMDISVLTGNDIVDFKKVINEELNGDVALFINNAGVSYEGAQRLDEIPMNKVEELLMLNTVNAIKLCKVVFEMMVNSEHELKVERKQSSSMLNNGRKKILNIGSGSSLIPTDPLYCVYAASKAAMANFSENLAIEAFERRVLVQCHSPLLIPSKLSKVKVNFMAPTTERYAKDAIDMIESSFLPPWGKVTRNPYVVHDFIILMSKFVPRPIWNNFRFRQTCLLRRKFIARKTINLN